LPPQAQQIRSRWPANSRVCFYPGWWTGRRVIGLNFGLYWGGYPFGWGYSPWLNYYPWWYWWTRPTWNACLAWLPAYGWNTGYWYDYGPGGNVVIQGGQVLIDGQTVGSQDEYAQTAQVLAQVDPAELAAVPPADWMPLGTFAMAVRSDEVDPARVVQLAISKNGLVSGTIHNRQSGNTYTVQGRVDPQTQRVAFTISDDSQAVLETGLYNLTQDHTTVLCHFPNRQTQVYLLARLPEPPHPESATTTPAAPDRATGEGTAPPPPPPATTPSASPPSPPPPARETSSPARETSSPTSEGARPASQPPRPAERGVER
jgi:hypothetical protein